MPAEAPAKEVLASEASAEEAAVAEASGEDYTMDEEFDEAMQSGVMKSAVLAK